MTVLPEREVPVRYPIRGTLFGCCASADEQSAENNAVSAKLMTVFLIGFLRVCCSLLFDHLICSYEHIRWNRQADLLGGFEINNQLKLHRLFYRQVSGLAAFEDLIHIRGSAAEHVGSAVPIGHEPSSVHELPLSKHGRQPIRLHKA